LHQNSFDEIDTYTSLKKQYYMMKLVYAYYEEGARALDQGADINALVKLPAREQIGRYKYTPEKEIDGAYQKITEELSRQMADLVGKEDE
ncbi:MAG: V-type ATP synthase subunit A, partial [Firmicutes bacterium]|nr:V-type ATP synthase subunit A [Bacillota bacterium]